MTVRPLHNKRNSIGYAAVYVDESTEATLPKCVPTIKRMRMIAKEMDQILDGAQDYLLRHMLDDDLSDEAKNAVFKAAMGAAYLKHYYDDVEHRMVYFPTCKELILHHGFIEAAESFFYQEKDRFPSDYKRAISSTVRALERERLLDEQENNPHRYDHESDESECECDSFDDLNSPSMHVRLDADMVDKFAGSWKCHDNLDLDDDIEDSDDDSFADDDCFEEDEI